MLRGVILLFSWILFHYVDSSLASIGCVQLDEYTFEKVISQFDVSLVKFDHGLPEKEKANVYSEIGKDAKSTKKLLVAEVGVKDYGTRDNEKLAERYGMTAKDFPVVKLFLKGNKEPITFTDATFTSDALRKFLKKEGGINLPLSGCIAELDALAVEFMAATENKKRTIILEKLEKAVNQFDNKQSTLTGTTYKIIMKRILEEGNSFISNERERVKKLIAAKLTREKKEELNQKLNILHTFLPEKPVQDSHKEL